MCPISTPIHTKSFLQKHSVTRFTQPIRDANGFVVIGVTQKMEIVERHVSQLFVMGNDIVMVETMQWKRENKGVYEIISLTYRISLFGNNHGIYFKGRKNLSMKPTYRAQRNHSRCSITLQWMRADLRPAVIVVSSFSFIKETLQRRMLMREWKPLRLIYHLSSPSSPGRMEKLLSSRPEGNPSPTCSTSTTTTFGIGESTVKWLSEWAAARAEKGKGLSFLERASYPSFRQLHPGSHSTHSLSLVYSEKWDWPPTHHHITTSSNICSRQPKEIYNSFIHLTCRSFYILPHFVTVLFQVK